MAPGTDNPVSVCPKEFDSGLTVNLSTEKEDIDSTLLVVEPPKVGSSLKPDDSKIGSTLG